jgi:hypothetical protein
MFIPDPDPYLLSIPDPGSRGFIKGNGSRIPDPQHCMLAHSEWPRCLLRAVWFGRVEGVPDSEQPGEPVPPLRLPGTRSHPPSRRSRHLLPGNQSCTQCCGSGMIFFGSDPGSGSDFSESSGSDPGSPIPDPDPDPTPDPDPVCICMNLHIYICICTHTHTYTRIHTTVYM